MSLTTPEIKIEPSFYGKDGKEFMKWFSSLLMAATIHGDYHKHPLGSCKLRDVIRDKKVKQAMWESWQRVILERKEVTDA